jgi:hypothetical protein
MIVAVQMLIVLGIPAAVLVAAARFRHVERMRVLEIANAAAERQQALSPDILRALNGVRPPPLGSADQRRGAFLIAIGAGLALIGLCLLIALASTGTPGAVAAGVAAVGLGAIPFCIGIALLFLSRVDASDLAA